MWTHTLVLLATIASTVFLEAASVRPVTRVWTDSMGRTDRMTLVEVEDSTVEFRTLAGSTLKVPIQQLSEADRHFISQLVVSGAGSPARREWPESVEIQMRDLEIELIDKDDNKPLGYVYRTAHFEFHSEADLGIAVMKDVGRVFEATRELLVRAPWKIDPKPPGKYFRAELYQTRESYVAAGGPPNSGGAFLRGKEKFMVPFESLGLKPVGNRYGMSQNYSVTTLVHELTHQMMREWLYVLPQWFVEGSAEYASIIPYSAGKFRCSGTKVALKEYVRKWKEKGYSPKVENIGSLLRMTNAEWNLTAARGFRVQFELYYESLLLTYYFMHLDGKGDGRRFYAWLDAVRGSKDEIATYFGRTAAGFETQEGVVHHRDATLSPPPKPPELLQSPEALEAAGSKHLQILLDGRTEQELQDDIRNAYSAIGVR